MATAVPSSADTKELYALVQQLILPEQRENALVELSKRRESFPDLAPVLWHSFGSITALLQEIISIYPALSPPTLTSPASNRVCNALALLQCVASHSETKLKLISISRHRPFEYLRLTSLGVIGALVKVDDPEIVGFLLETEIIPLCLRIMETGTELSKTVATFIVQKILLDEAGLTYICATAERFYAVSSVLSSMVTKLMESPSARLLKHIVRCYLRLSDNARARDALKQCLPEALKDQTFAATLASEDSVQRWLALLLKNLAIDSASSANLAQSTPAPGMTSTPQTKLVGGTGATLPPAASGPWQQQA
eukprot:scaffold14367_cov250-Ochromonas_danica.AAC.27